MPNNGNNQTPENILDRTDPGDDVQMRFRYQHAYGLILLLGAASGNNNYRAIWCEHHDDLLGEMPDGQFDSYQVKTREVGQPPWKTTDDAFDKCLKKFVEQDTLFPNQIGHFHFVTNHTHFRTTIQSQLTKSPLRLKHAIDKVPHFGELDEPFCSFIQGSAGRLDKSPEQVFEVLRRLRFVRGPSLDDFDDVVAHTHLPSVSACTSLPPARLDAIRDELIHKIFAASSLQVPDPSKHWCCIAGEDAVNPRLRAKRITVRDVLDLIDHHSGPPFRFAPADRSINLHASSDLTPLEKKAIKGGLMSYLPTFGRLTLSAERHLLEMANRKEQEIDEILNQLHGVVKGECDEARLHASVAGETFGREMMCIAQQRLRERASQRPETVYRQEYECLLGIAGLLTKECEVWWSDEFPLEEEA